MAGHVLRLGGIALVALMGAVVPVQAWCVRGVAGWDTLRIRSGPSPHAPEVGAIPPSACNVTILGGCRGSWCPVSWRGRQGWSNATYLSRGSVFDGWRLPGLLLPPPAPPRLAWARPFPDRPPVPPPRVVPRRAGGAAHSRAIRPTPAPRPAAVSRAARPVEGPAPVERAAAPPAAPKQVATPEPAAPAAVAATAVVPTPPAAAPSPPTPDVKLAAPPKQPPAKTAELAAGSEACVANVATGDTLKVRAGPGLDQALRYGFPSTACGVKLTGPCNDGWCPVDYRGYRGWAERKFLK